MADIKIICPKCNAEFTVSDSLIGRLSECSQCKTRIRISDTNLNSCNNCGSTIESVDAKFCSKCGNPINTNVEQAIPSIINTKIAGAQEPTSNIKIKQTVKSIGPKKVFKKIGMVICMIITALGVLTAFIRLLNGSGSLWLNILVLIGVVGALIYGQITNQMKMAAKKFSLIYSAGVLVVFVVEFVWALATLPSSEKATRVITDNSKSYISDDIIVRLGCAPEQLEVILGHPTDISHSDRDGNETWTYENNPREIYSFQNGLVTQIITVEVNYNEVPIR